jgi:aspartyl protease family protein
MTLSRKYLPVTVLVALAVFSLNIVAARPDLRIVGLFKDRAVVFIDGKQRLLTAGETSPEGVLLLSADSDGAVFEIDGQRIEKGLDGRVMPIKNRPTAASEVQIWRNTSGMFTTTGSINGLPVGFLVDTGATQVAMNAAQARRLGIDYRVDGRPANVTTASGVVKAYTVMLDSVKVGDIKLLNVAGVVIEGAQPERVLLGMSYLGRVQLSNEGQLMTLRKKY